MKDIVDEAIYFDMYYFTKPPALGQKAEVFAVAETTPQFQNFQISDVVCNGAKKGIFIRGLPEMSVKNISITNAVLKADRGAEIIEAEGISLKNVNLISSGTNPVVYLENSSAISINDLGFNSNADILLKVNGDRSKNIRLLNTDANDMKNKVLVENGAKFKSVLLR